jgi:hypothetical protein
MVETEAALPGTVHEAAALDDHVPPLVVRRSNISDVFSSSVADPDPDPLVRGMDPDPSIILQK